MESNLCSQMREWVRYTETLHGLYLATCAMSLAFSLVSTIGNALVVLAIIRSPSLHTPSYVLMGTLAVSDFCVGFVVQPLFVAVRVAEMKEDPAIYCTLGLAYFSSCGLLLWMSCLTIVAVSVDRFLAVYLKVQYRSVVTMKRVLLAVVLLTLAAGLFAAVYVINMTGYYIVINAVIPFCLICTGLCYFKISRILHRHQAQICNHMQPRVQANETERCPNHLGFNAVRYRRSVNTVLYVYIAYLVCYLPYLGFSIAVNILERTRLVHTAYLVTATIVLSNSMFNPLCYYWRMSEIRSAIKRIFHSGP